MQPPAFCIDDVSRDTKLSAILAKVPASWERDAEMAVPDTRDLRLAIKVKVPKTDNEIEVLDSNADAKQVDLFNNATDLIIVHVSIVRDATSGASSLASVWPGAADTVPHRRRTTLSARSAYAHRDGELLGRLNLLRVLVAR